MWWEPFIYQKGTMLADNKILVVIDIQNGFIKTQGHVENVKQITNLIKYCNFDKVVATKFINYTDSLYEKCFNWSELKNVRHD